MLHIHTTNKNSHICVYICLYIYIYVYIKIAYETRKILFVKGEEEEVKGI
jgi:hypothetical protein